MAQDVEHDLEASAWFAAPPSCVWRSVADNGRCLGHKTSGPRAPRSRRLLDWRPGRCNRDRIRIGLRRGHPAGGAASLISSLAYVGVAACHIHIAPIDRARPYTPVWNAHHSGERMRVLPTAEAQLRWAQNLNNWLRTCDAAPEHLVKASQDPRMFHASELRQNFGPLLGHRVGCFQRAEALLPARDPQRVRTATGPWSGPPPLHRLSQLGLMVGRHRWWALGPCYPPKAHEDLRTSAEVPQTRCRRAGEVTNNP